MNNCCKGCISINCPCHTTKVSDWENAFEEIYYSIHPKQAEEDLISSRHRAFIARGKSFISTLLQEAEQRGREEMRKDK